ncbi:rhodanese-like domain-containing protein [Sphingobium yanoikuyae]|uniref:rhodanese-like domain-containing protein n=1 Tax=Sphingobium yanoikuyae TaxID=13690 RepID=UPI0022DCF7E1|nr:rhodanese-like domain-containing protein [Sphingobium yanoikuyae]WBQ17586.1 rhodanese-like domain-containing protein [Sphingobium yanoikuyae]
MAIASMTPQDAKVALSRGATLIDIRDADEHARERIDGAVNLPLAQIGSAPLPSGLLIFHCRTGMRTSANAGALEAAADGAPCYLLDGGIDAWRGCGLGTIVDRKQPIEIMRQVQLTAGGLILLGVLLGWLVAPGFYGLSAFIGAGLMFAGATGWCGMAHLLRIMPWNRVAA